MPEGDTIHRAANRVGALISDRVPQIATPNVRKNADRWPQRLAGQRVTSVDAHGKHLFIRFEGGLAIHSHLRMTGAWGAYAPDQRWGRSAKKAWLTLRTDDGVAVQFGGPLLELLTEARARSHVQRLGPDILAPQLDEQRFLTRLREDDPTRPFGDALLDQSTIAGIGNMWKAEGCFAVGLAPWRPAAQVSDEDALAVLRATATMMAQAVADGRTRHRQHAVYRRAGKPCLSCGGAIVSRGQGDDNRTTYWCTVCQS